MRALDGPAGGELRELLGAPLAGAAWDRARELVRSGDAVDQAVASARSYVDWAVAELEPMRHRPAARALEGAAHHLLNSIATLRAA
jgi:geranylgeranyl pyrophosphate synthase